MVNTANMNSDSVLFTKVVEVLLSGLTKPTIMEIYTISDIINYLDSISSSSDIQIALKASDLAQKTLNLLSKLSSATLNLATQQSELSRNSAKAYSQRVLDLYDTIANYYSKSLTSG
jgi:hypothetical protein